MKKILSFAVSLLFLAPGCIGKDGPIERLWESEKGLLVPESVFYCPGENILFVSNINGKPTEKNGRGFISRVTLEGKIEKLRWATGLNAPKGMGVHGDLLYVTDIDRLVALNMNNGSIKKVYATGDAKFLNDIAIAADGTVYISDMQTDSLYRLRDGKLSRWLTSPLLEGPNGMLMQGDYLLVGVNNSILKVDTGSGSVKKLVDNTGVSIDGLRDTGKGSFIISNWQGKTMIVAPDRKPLVLLDTTDKKINSADLEYIESRNLLIIPTFFDNHVVGYRIKP